MPGDPVRGRARSRFPEPSYEEQQAALMKIRGTPMIGTERMDKMLEIPSSVIVKVVAALTMAIGVTPVHAKECHAAIMEAAMELDDAIQDAEATEE